MAYTDTQAESYVLGAMLADSTVRADALAELAPAHFYSETHRKTFAAISSANETTGALSPREFADEEVKAFARDTLLGVPPTLNYREHRSSLVECYRKQKADDFSRVLLQSLENGADSEQVISEALSGFEGLLTTSEADGAAHLSSGSDEVLQRARAAVENEGVVGIRTGFAIIDHKLGGLQTGRNYILGARAGVGKSTAALAIALNAARQGHRVLVQSSEMPLVDYLERTARSMASITESQWEAGDISSKAFERLGKALSKVEDLPIYVDGTPGPTPEGLRRNIARVKPDLVIVDYLQRMSLAPERRGRSEYEDVSRLSLDVDRLKQVANVPLVTVVQLNRNSEHRQGNKPTMADIRSSGQLEQDANVILLLHREAKYDETADENRVDVYCAKNRHGSDMWSVGLWKTPGLSHLSDDKALANASL